MVLTTGGFTKVPGFPELIQLPALYHTNRKTALPIRDLLSCSAFGGIHSNHCHTDLWCKKAQNKLIEEQHSKYST